jgi:hypothetical protein
MTIIEIIRQGFYYARTCKSLWLFGFVVGLASGGSNGGGGGGGNGDAGGAAAAIGALGAAGAASGGDFLNWSGPRSPQLAAIAIFILLAIAACVVLRFLSEGALIEGVVKARQGGAMTMREGFRAGWAHWGVIFRIALLYFAAIVATLALIAAPCVIVFKAFGVFGAVLFAVPALVVAVPWFVTLYVVQEFAWRIAVLENRHALDAIAKARLFLHGRLLHALKLIVATFVGSLGFALAAIVTMVPVVLVMVALIPVLDVFPVIAIAGVILLPLMYVLAAMLGTFRSSIWTIGYVTEVPQVES